MFLIRLLRFVLMILGFWLLPLNDYLASFKQQLFNPQFDLQASSLEIRASQWQEASQFLSDNFFFGAGLSGYQEAIAFYHQVDWIEVYLYPHNIVLNFWIELGLLGLVAWIAIMIYVLKTLLSLHRQSNAWAWPLSMFWLTWLAHGLVDVPYFKNDLSVLFFIMLAFSLVVTPHQPRYNPIH